MLTTDRATAIEDAKKMVQRMRLGWCTPRVRGCLALFRPTTGIAVRDRTTWCTV